LNVTTAPRISLRGLEKSFGANRVLRGVDLAIDAGTIHALVGGNGAGKSTLSKIVAGIEPADAGELTLDGVAYRPANRSDAQARGVVMVLQELNILPTLSVAENLFLRALPTSRGGFINRARLNELSRAALARVGLERIDPETPAAMLGVGQQQLVELAAGVAQQCRLLILDEPTAALTGAEVRTLFNLLRELQRDGTAILYISHRLDEIAAIADQVSVLRDGQLVKTLPARLVSHQELIRLMAGREIEQPALREARANSGPLALRVSNLQSARGVHGVSFALHGGEIVGLGGLVGAGRTELLRAIFGADPIEGGTMTMGADETPFRPAATRDAVAAGMAFVPEDRKQHALFAPLSVEANASIARLPTRAGFPGLLAATAERTGVAQLLAELEVRYASAGQPIRELSGGNQQKVIIGRWLRRDVRIWLLDEPTRGVDAAARISIYRLLRARCAAGEALLVASSDYDELALLCDRVLVLSNGRLAGEFNRETLNPTAFTAAAFSGYAKGAAA
jgi:ribose transport system ATP-binding protein